jgi:molecular chaperone GrpE
MMRGDPRRRAGRRRREDLGPTRAETGTAPEQLPMIPGGECCALDGTPPEVESEVETVPQTDEQAESSIELIESLRDQLLRLQAEFDNYRKRQAREFHRMCAQGRRDLILEILSVLDNIDRGLEHRAAGAPAEEILPGLFQTAEQLGGILSREGLEPIPIAPLDLFDPNLHEAVVAEDREDVEHDVVLEVFRRGYTFEQDLLRPALVKVGRAVRPAPQEE